MKQRKVDFLSRRPVQAIMLTNCSGNNRAVASRLPVDYIFENGKFNFPAGFWESYFVNGKEYNVDGNRSLEQQKELIIQDLAGEGFDSEEAKEFINALEIKEGSRKLLNYEWSMIWLELHPEFEREAIKKLKEAEAEFKKEGSFESSKRSRRK